jgi:hypothetical protein
MVVNALSGACNREGFDKQKLASALKDISNKAASLRSRPTSIEEKQQLLNQFNTIIDSAFDKPFIDVIKSTRKLINNIVVK